MADEKADIGASDREDRTQQRHRPPQSARSPCAPAQAQHDHRILWFDDRAGPVLVRTAIARFVVVGGAAGCDLHDPKRLYLLFHRPSAGYLPSRGRARAGSPAAADFLHHFWSFSLCARGGVAAAMVAEPMRRSNVLPFPRSVRPHAAED